MGKRKKILAKSYTHPYVYHER